MYFIPPYPPDYTISKSSSFLIKQDSTKFLRKLTPTSPLLDEILAKRQQAMESMVDAVHNEIERYSNPDTNLCIYGEPSCDAMMLGLLFRAFRKIKIYPEASAVTTKSVEEVRSILQKIEFPEYIRINQPTGCCKSPLLNATTQISRGFGHPTFGSTAPTAFASRGLFGGGSSGFGASQSTFGVAQVASPTTENQDSTCVNCRKKYQALQTRDVNHTESCPPLTRLKKNLDDIVARVTGLVYFQFVRKPSSP